MHYSLMSNIHERIRLVKAASQSVSLVQMVKGVKAGSQSIPLEQMVKEVVDPITVGKLHLIRSETNRERAESVCPGAQVKLGGAESFFSELPRVKIDFRRINSRSSLLSVFW